MSTPTMADRVEGVSDVSTGTGLPAPDRGADAPVVRPVRRRLRAPWAR